MILPILVAITLTADPIYTLNEAQITGYLATLQSSDSSFESRLRTVIDDSLGTAYADGPLGEGEGAQYDADPLVDLTKVDCVTFVEQAVAMAITPDYSSMVDTLQHIRYKDGKIDYEARNHFMITDWIRNNPYCVEVTRDLGVPTETVTRRISRKDFFKLVKAPGLGESTPDEQVALSIVPTAAAKAAESKLPDTALIVFVGKIDWLFALHCGFYIRDENGTGHLVHASSKVGEVIKMNLTDYIAEQKDRYLGFAAYEITEPKN